MRYVRPDVATYGMGQAASAAAVLLAAGAPGKRYILPNARVLLHQPHGGVEGQTSDIEIHAREIAFQRRRVDEILASVTGQTVERIAADTERDFILRGEEAVAYGVVDRIITHRHLIPIPGVAAPAATRAG
jgi:ATP-dependent Clp protease protease subunit